MKLFPAAMFATLTTTAFAQDSAEFVWHTSLPKPRALATAQGKPLLLLFRCEQ